MGETKADNLSSGKRLGRDTLVYGLAFVLSRAASFIMLPVYTRYLSTSDYGTLHLLQMSVDVASILLSAGVTAGVHRYYFKEDSDSQRNAVLVVSLLMLVGFNILGTLLLYAFADTVAVSLLNDASQAGLVRIAATSFTLDGLIVVPMLLLQVRQRSLAYSAASIARLVLQLSLNILFVVFLLEGVRGILISTLITNSVIGLGMTVWMFRETGFSLGKKLAGPLFRFGLPYRVTAAGAFVLTYADRFFLNEARGLSDTGIYSLAYQFGFLLMYLGPAPFHLAWDPQRFQLVDRPRAERDAAYQQGFLYFSLLLVTLAVGISLFVRPMLSVMSAPEFHPAADVVPLIMVGFLCQAWGQVMEFGIQVSERTTWTSVGTWISVGVILLLYSVLIPQFGMWGAALATVGGFGTRWICFGIAAQRLFPITYGLGRAAALVAVGAVAVGASYIVAADGLLPQLAAATSLTLVYFVGVWFAVLRAEERATIVEFGGQIVGKARGILGA
ncbi:MAG: O-antigen/teichoic acid export membrane protein [Myxococcota bacterium]|jgi:O-antigen/teichoic acid export membrane protein